MFSYHLSETNKFLQGLVGSQHLQPQHEAYSRFEFEQPPYLSYSHTPFTILKVESLKITTINELQLTTDPNFIQFR